MCSPGGKTLSAFMIIDSVHPIHIGTLPIMLFSWDDESSNVYASNSALDIMQRPGRSISNFSKTKGKTFLEFSNSDFFSTESLLNSANSALHGASDWDSESFSQICDSPMLKLFFHSKYFLRSFPSPTAMSAVRALTFAELWPKISSFAQRLSHWIRNLRAKFGSQSKAV